MLALYAGKPIDEIDTEAVLSVLQPLWQSVPETASRLRERIEAVLDAAKAQGHRHGENPAQWRGHLDKLLPKRQKLSRGHHTAMPYSQVPAFVARLREREAVAGLALEFCILTAARSGEVLGARWPEFDLEAKVWTIPAARMKAGKEHRVPLSARAVTIIQRLAEGQNQRFCLSWPALWQAALRHGDGDGASPDEDRRHGSWLSVELSGLVRGRDTFPTGDRRSGIGTRHRQRGRSGLPAR